MVIGSFISDSVVRLQIKNLVVPGFVVCMFLAIIFRNINDKIEFVKIDFKVLGYLQFIGLNFFLTMAIMTLRVWELIDLALPLIVILLIQTLFALLFIRFITWRLLKKDYTSVVLCAGLTSGVLGTTATALATMSSVCEKYQVFARNAFLFLPFCTSIMLDVFNAPLIILFLNLLH
jgi:ESS family glutamate:Na+ symporter